MDIDVDAANAILADVRDVTHPYNRLCGSLNEHGLRLKFRMEPNGDVTADLDCAATYQGFPGIVHGGVLSAMLDSAMSNCMFARRIDAVTAELLIRFHHPVWTLRSCTVRARLDKSTSRLHFLSGEVLQDGRIAASATAKFMNRPASPPPTDG
jgi:acyl-coenzyme A thioesterase PaaI-like protein